VWGANSPSSGGLGLSLMLNLLEGTDVANLVPYSADHVHRLAEVQNIAFADRNQYMADADFANVPTDGLLSKGYAKSRKILMGTFLTPSTPIPPGIPPGAPNQTLPTKETQPELGTTHFMAADKWGNVVVVTSTIEAAFGSAVTVPGRGFLLNNELTDFDPIGTIGNTTIYNGPEGGKKLRRTALGTDSSTYGGKRPRSSMTPTIVTKNGKPVFAFGAPGGSFIVGYVFNSLHKALDFDMCLRDSASPPYVISRNGAMSLPANDAFWGSYAQLVANLEARGFQTPVPYDQYSHTLSLKIAEDRSYVGAVTPNYRLASVQTY